MVPKILESILQALEFGVRTSKGFLVLPKRIDALWDDSSWLHSWVVVRLVTRGTLEKQTFGAQPSSIQGFPSYDSKESFTYTHAINK